MFGSYYADIISIVKFAKGHNSIKNIGDLWFLFSARRFDDALYLYQVS